MHVALGVALGSIVAAPAIGRWRANVWLRRREEAYELEAAVHRRPMPSNVIEIVPAGVTQG